MIASFRTSRKEVSMRQLAFELMCEWGDKKTVLMEEKMKEELIGYMATAIIEIFSREGEKTDDGFSEKR
jgi:hypothetical protein